MLNDFYQTLNPIAFQIGPLSVRWYGIAYLLGFFCSGLIIWRVSKRWKLGLTSDDILTTVVSVALGVIVGARLGYVLFYGNGFYLAHPLSAFALSEGGMSFHGGLLGALAGGFAASRILRIPFLTLADLGAICAPVGLFFGRCANFINGELWGKPCDLPWAVVFSSTGGGTIPRHPSQLYEALLEGAVLLAIMLAMARKLPPRPRGTFLGLFLVCYGVFRSCIELVRIPDAQLGYLYGGWLTMGMLLCVPVFLAGVALLLWAHKHALPQTAARS